MQNSRDGPIADDDASMPDLSIIRYAWNVVLRQIGDSMWEDKLRNRE